MKTRLQELEDPFDFRQKATLGVALAAFVLLTPFALNHVVQGHPYLGSGSLAIVMLLAGNAWRIWRGRYSPALTLLAIVPAVILYLMLTSPVTESNCALARAMPKSWFSRVPPAITPAPPRKKPITIKIGLTMTLSRKI